MITVALKEREAAGILVDEAKKVAMIAIPSMSDTGLESDVCAHFGSCEHFTL